MEHGSARVLLAGVVDYAGLFPPARVSMAEAVEEYAAARQGAPAVFGRFALPQPEDQSPGVGLRRALVLLTCISATFLYAMTVTIANVSLPQIQGALSASPDQIAWIVTSNIVATAVVTPTSGWLVSRFGWRNVCGWSILAFAAASLACGLADSLGMLVVARALQGGFGAPLVPVSQAIVVAVYPRRQHGAVIAVFGVGAVLGPIVGPMVGGYLSEAYNWRWVFYMILPFSAPAVVRCRAASRVARRPIAGRRA
jgi:DHA2 family multidrug resistance protein